MKGLSLFLLAAGVLIGCGSGPEPPRNDPASVEAHSERDAEVFAALEAYKPDLSKPRHARFFLYFPSRESAERARSRLAKSSLGSERGYQVKVEADEGNRWLCMAEAEMVVDPDRIGKLRVEFHALAEREKGEYDGWECAATP